MNVGRNPSSAFNYLHITGSAGNITTITGDANLIHSGEFELEFELERNYKIEELWRILFIVDWCIR